MGNDAEVLFQLIVKKKSRSSEKSSGDLSFLLNSIGKDKLDDCCLEGKD